MINNVVLVGRITKDIDLKTGNSGKHYCTFTLAVNRMKAQEGTQEADFITCKAFNNTAKNLSSYCGRGSLIGIEGSIQTGSYQGKDGNTVYTFSVLANRVQFLESKKQQQNNNFNQNQNNNFNQNQNFGYNQNQNNNNNFNSNQNFGYNQQSNSFNNNQNFNQNNSIDFFEAMDKNFNSDNGLLDSVNPFKE